MTPTEAIRGNPAHDETPRELLDSPFWDTELFQHVAARAAPKPARVIRVGSTVYSTPTKVDGMMFVGTVYEYRVVDEAGNTVTGSIAVTEYLSVTDKTKELSNPHTWGITNGQFKDFVGYRPGSGPLPQNYYNENHQIFTVAQNKVTTTLSTIILQRVWSEGGNFFGQSDIIVR